MLTKIRKLRNVKKRSGEIVDFDKSRIQKAIKKAMDATDSFDQKTLDNLVSNVILVLESKFINKIPSIEDIQDTVEYVLISQGLTEIAKTYILYREERRKYREAQPKEEDCDEVKLLKKNKIDLSKQAINILNNSAQFRELGKIIFLDRYSVKSKKNDLEKGDILVVVTKDDSKYPKKDLGIIKEIINDNLKIHMLTGVYADKKNNFEFTQEKNKVEKPIESVNDAYKRVAKAVASVETDDIEKNNWFDEFWYHLRHNYIQPAGRIMTGASVSEFGYTNNLTLYNCYVIPSPRDSRKSIVKDTLFNLTEVFSRGGGCGVSLSTLRPKYTYVKGVHGRSSGAVSFGDLYSFMTGLIEQGGSRRGALMLMLSDWHPDIEDFIEAKNKAGKLENANISVLVSDALMKAVKEDGDWFLEFPDLEDKKYKQIYDEEWDGDLAKWKLKNYPTKIYKKLKAKELWDKIIASAWSSAEPGIVFHDRYNNMSNSYYYSKIIATNPCGEQGLPEWGVCNLGHLYLSSFVDKVGVDEVGPIYELNWNKLKKSARVLTRFLDNIIDLTPYFFEENKHVQKSERRIGAGTLGLAELLIKLRIRYGSKESLQFIDKLYKTITTEMYLESSKLSQEKGFFPKFDSTKFLNSGFMKGMPNEVIEKIKENGIRNVSITTQAPTGTVGTMLGTSTGIEPYFAFKYYRQSRLGFYEEKIPVAKIYEKDGKLPEFFISAMELKPEEHIKVQATIQKWTDSSISKTANVPADYTLENTKELYEKAYDLGCKGVTIYRDSSRDEQILYVNKDDNSKDKEKNSKDKKEATDKVYGAEVGNICPNCKEGTMVKVGGCTECSKGCGFKGSCDMK